MPSGKTTPLSNTNPEPALEYHHDDHMNTALIKLDESLEELRSLGEAEYAFDDSPNPNDPNTNNEGYALAYETAMKSIHVLNSCTYGSVTKDPPEEPPKKKLKGENYVCERRDYANGSNIVDHILPDGTTLSIITLVDDRTIYSIHQGDKPLLFCLGKLNE